jgi:enoyl-CoA hydratase/carnithine racemase
VIYICQKAGRQKGRLRLAAGAGPLLPGTGRPPRTPLSRGSGMADYSDVSGEAVQVLWATDGVLSVMLNRPQKMNAFNGAMWTEVREVFRRVSSDAAVRCVVVSAAGKNFTAGLDLAAVGQADGAKPERDVGRKAYAMRDHVLEIQESFNAIEACGRPVIGCAHGACIGAGTSCHSAATEVLFLGQRWL